MLFLKDLKAELAVDYFFYTDFLNADLDVDLTVP